MARAIVIKQIGDTDTCNAIADGIMKIVPLDNGEMKALRAELARLQAENETLRTSRDIHVYGDSRRLRRARRELARKYQTKPINGLEAAILTVWGTLWYLISTAYGQLVRSCEG